jgi:hypothetical protein
MSNGNRPVLVRLEPRLREAVEKAVEKSNRHRPRMEYTISSFVREAIVEKLAHRERSAGKRKPTEHQCEFCMGWFDIADIDSTMELLGGGNIFRCIDCDKSHPE